MTEFQQIEYAIGLSLGRSVSDAFGTLGLVSGAFGAFRADALREVGGFDAEVGEDADLTMKLRRAGWRVRFAAKAWALTDVPETTPAFIAQRLRWDRGLITIWFRKFRGMASPRYRAFRPSDAYVLLDIIFFQILLALAFPVYVAWLFYHFGTFAITIIGAALIAYAVLDVISFMAAIAIGSRLPLSSIFYMPLYLLLQLTVVRTVRVIAIIQELVFVASYRDPYVPRRVMRQVEQR